MKFMKSHEKIILTIILTVLVLLLLPIVIIHRSPFMMDYITGYVLLLFGLMFLTLFRTDKNTSKNKIKRYLTRLVGAIITAFVLFGGVYLLITFTINANDYVSGNIKKDIVTVESIEINHGHGYTSVEKFTAKNIVTGEIDNYKCSFLVGVVQENNSYIINFLPHFNYVISATTSKVKGKSFQPQ